MTAIAGRKSLVKVTGDATNFADEATTGEATHKIFTITAATKNCWDPSAPITVKVDGAAVTTGFTVERLVGRVTFAASKGASVVTVSGKYLPLSTAAGCREYTINRARALIDVSDFDVVDDYKKNLAGKKDASGTLSVWYQNDSYFFDAMDSDAPIVLEFYADRGSAFTMRAWTNLTKCGISSAQDSAVDHPIEWSGTQDADGNVVAIR
jgi:predicted secreted protein